MGFLIGALLFLLAKLFLPAILLYTLLIILIAVTAIYIISAICSRDADEIGGIIGGIILIIILINMWGWV